jgi:hypothetical protein
LSSERTEIKMRKQIGIADVDSGQIMVTDPCYVDKFKMNRPFTSEGDEELDEAAPGTYPYSYSGACAATTDDDKHGGQLNHPAGHPGAGVVTGTGVGDGSFPVFAEYDENGVTERIIVEFANAPIYLT